MSDQKILRFPGSVNVAGIENVTDQAGQYEPLTQPTVLVPMPMRLEYTLEVGAPDHITALRVSAQVCRHDLDHAVQHCVVRGRDVVVAGSSRLELSESQLIGWLLNLEKRRAR